MKITVRTSIIIVRPPEEVAKVLLDAEKAVLRSIERGESITRPLEQGVKFRIETERTMLIHQMASKGSARPDLRLS
jgi:hypothetical protein